MLPSEVLWTSRSLPFCIMLSCEDFSHLPSQWWKNSTFKRLWIFGVMVFLLAINLCNARGAPLIVSGTRHGVDTLTFLRQRPATGADVWKFCQHSYTSASRSWKCFWDLLDSIAPRGWNLITSGGVTSRRKRIIYLVASRKIQNGQLLHR